MSFTENQQKAIEAEGNVLVLAGAGTGKTSTMVSRCLDRVFHPDSPTDLDRILMVTFTEAAAAEMKQRIGSALRERLADSEQTNRVNEQIALLDTAKIGTLHSIALDIIREFAHELQLSSGLRVLSSEESYRLSESALSEVFTHHYEQRESESRSLCDQIRQAAQGNDRPIRTLVIRIYQYAQSLPRPDQWIQQQTGRNNEQTPTQWIGWLLKSLPNWIDDWLPLIREGSDECQNLETCYESLRSLQETLSLQNMDPKSPLNGGKSHLEGLVAPLHRALATDSDWLRGQKTRFRKPIETFYSDLQFLTSLLPLDPDSKSTPINEDWDRCRTWILCLLQLTKEFESAYSRSKGQLEGLDFQDLEQLSLKVLYDPDREEFSPVSNEIQNRFDYVFVDEYQDINGAQDALVKALCRHGDRSNLFIVGDIKQSIYRFRRANPDILKDYERVWNDLPTPTNKIYLQANFRSRPPLLDFVNDFCGALSDFVPGFEYGPDARLDPGRGEVQTTSEESPQAKNAPTELHLIVQDGIKDTDLSPLEAEVHIIAQRLRSLLDSGSQTTDSSTGEPRPTQWSDIAILLRSVSDRPQIFARIFASYGIPIQAATGAFFDFPEVADLISLLKVIDNPLQDIPLIALLHSPFFGFTASELAIIRLALPKGHFWNALKCFLANHSNPSPEEEPKENPLAKQLVEQTFEKCERLIANYEQWILSRRTATIAGQIEEILSSGFYVEFISSLNPTRNPKPHIQQLIQIAQEFEKQPDASLTHFLRWIDALTESEHEIEALPEETTNAVQLMSIHKSKGLEFPVVVLPDLAKRFNLTDLSQPLIIDENLGLCPILHLPNTAETYPSLPHWLSQREHRTQLIDEESRLLYVALTRAQDHLILVGSITNKQLEETWQDLTENPSQSSPRHRSFLDWLGPWFINRYPGQSASLSDKGFQAEGHATIHYEVQEKPPLTESVDLIPAKEASQFTNENLTSKEAEELNKRLDWNYRFNGSTVQRAKASISALERLSKLEAPPLPFETVHSEPNQTRTTGRNATGKSIGLAYHRILQYLPPALGAQIETTRNELAQMEEDGVITSEELHQIDLEKIVSFWTSKPGSAIRSQADRTHRELPFTARFTINELTELGFVVTDDPASVEESVILQGIVDLAVITENEIWLLDFKSEQVHRDNVEESARHHSEQLAVYRLALEKIYRKPVTKSWIHFLQPGVTYDLLSGSVE
jgi:ATP-dependent helicase/nuclease subunit A